MFSPIFREMVRPVRAKLLEELKRSDGLPVAELARMLKMSYMGVKQHCAGLEEGGFLKAVRVPRKEAGRPERLYQLTSKCDDLFPEAGSDVTIQILGEMCAVYGDTAAEKVLFRFFQSRKEAWAPKIRKGKSLVEKATRLVELRDATGAFSRCEYDKELGFQIEEFHNPLQPIFDKYPSAFRLELLMMEELLGTKIEHTEIAKKGKSKKVVYLIRTLG